MGRRKPAPRLLSRGSLARRVGQRNVKKTVVVVCEGAKTEPQYIGALARQPAVSEAAAVELRIEGAGKGAVPLTLVRRAVDIVERSAGESGEIDEVWCVFDVEWPRNHPDLDVAMRLAAESGIKIAVSNPCFEVWLVLHFEDCTQWLDNDGARRARRRCDGQNDKTVRADDYMSARHRAAARAEGLERRHAENGTVFPHDNPSSSMYKLLRSVEAPPPTV